MKKILFMFDKLLQVLMALCLAFMAILVFGNVVLRYAFHSGITWSEEMSRFLFIWMVFLGSIVALKDGSHLGMDLVVTKLPDRVRRIVLIVGQLIILYILGLVLQGSWKMTMDSLESKAPATGLPLSFIYGIGIVLSIGMIVITFTQMYKTISQHKNSSIKKIENLKEEQYRVQASGGEQ